MLRLFLNAFCGGADNIDDEVGLRQHCDVTAVDSMSGRTHALGYEALQIGVDRLVLRGQNVPARFGLPGRAYHFLVEEVRSRRIVRCPDDLLLLLGKVAREILHAVREHPNSPVRRRNVPEYVGGGEFAQLAINRLVSIGCDRRDIDQSDNTVVRSRRCYDRAAVRVADKDGWATHPSQRAFHCGDVPGVRVEAVLGGYHFVSLRLKWRNYFVKA